MRQQVVNSSQTPRGTLQRAPLPLDQLNPHVKNLDPAKPPTVKFQEIVRDGAATIVGRVKIPTPSGHAFILRRLDTGAISLTTMFRAAFPAATEDAERAEAAWVKNHFDIAGANKSGKARFAGTWVSPEVAVEISESYNLTSIIIPLAEAVPDPNVVYRKSQRPQGTTPTSSPAPLKATPREVQPPATKRRREASPSPVQAAPVAPPTPATKRGVSPRTPAPATPATRRSARLKSPAAPALTPLAAKVSPKATRTKPAQSDTAKSYGSERTLVDSDEIMEVTKVAAPSMEEDIREQKELIARLKAEKEAAEKAKAEAEAELAQTAAAAAEEEAATVEVPAVSSTKRLREEESVEFKLNVKEPETEERALVSNSRIRGLRDMPPERKSLAWGALLFAAGMGAMTFLPSLPSFL